MSPDVKATIGNATTATAESKSAPMLTVRRPIWSTSHPPIGEINNPGSAETAATNPANGGRTSLFEYQPWNCDHDNRIA